MKAIASPTGMSWPSSAISWARVPASSASSSIVTLSVSISAMASPSETSSPSLLSHLRSVPSSIASPILGMMTSGTLLLLLVHNPAGRVLDLFLAREGHQLEVARVRPWDLGAAHPFYGGVQRIEGPVLDDRRNLARHPEPPPLLLHGHGPVRLLHRPHDGVLIEGTQGSQVYDLGLETALRERIRDPQAQVDLTAVGDERHVGALAGDAGLAERHGVIAVRRQEREVPGHHLDDGAHAHHGHADGGADEPVLGDGNVHDALGSVFVVETIGDEVGAAVDTYVLAHKHHVLVVVE